MSAKPWAHERAHDEVPCRQHAVYVRLLRDMQRRTQSSTQYAHCTHGTCVCPHQESMMEALVCGPFCACSPAGRLASPSALSTCGSACLWSIPTHSSGRQGEMLIEKAGPATCYPACNGRFWVRPVRPMHMHCILDQSTRCINRHHLCVHKFPTQGAAWWKHAPSTQRTHMQPCLPVAARTALVVRPSSLGTDTRDAALGTACTPAALTCSVVLVVCAGGSRGSLGCGGSSSTWADGRGCSFLWLTRLEIGALWAG
jgi:hypothetical protein